MNNYRDNGAIDALLDEYEKVIFELQSVIETISSIELISIVDPHTDDASFRSIQTILSHVIRAGYTYVIEVRKYLGEDIDYKDEILLDNISLYKNGLNEMFLYNESLFKDYPKIKIEEKDNNKKMKVRWGQSYDIEQILEHAIVHILRHRRQIERFLITLRQVKP